MSSGEVSGQLGLVVLQVAGIVPTTDHIIAFATAALQAVTADQLRRLRNEEKRKRAYEELP